MRAKHLTAIIGMALINGSALLASGASDVTILGPDGKPAKAQDATLQALSNMITWELVAFGLLLVVLSVAVFPKMFGALKARQDKIESALAKADKVQAEAEILLKKHEAMMTEANAQAKKVTDEAISAAEKARNQILEEAKKESRAIVERAREEIRLDQNKALAEVRHAAVELSLLASSAILEKSLNDADHKRLAEQAINQAAGSLASRN